MIYVYSSWSQPTQIITCLFEYYTYYVYLIRCLNMYQMLSKQYTIISRKNTHCHIRLFVLNWSYPKWFFWVWQGAQTHAATYPTYCLEVQGKFGRNIHPIGTQVSPKCHPPIKFIQGNSSLQIIAEVAWQTHARPILVCECEMVSFCS